MSRSKLLLTLVLLGLIGLASAQVDTAWVRRYNGPPGNGGDYAYAIAVDDSGNVYVTGSSSGGAAPGTGSDYATIKYNSAGVEQWVSRYNGPGNVSDIAKAIAVDGSGNVYVTGQSSGGAAPGTGNDYATIKYNSAGVAQWVSRYNGPGNGSDVALALAVDGAGNVYVTGNSKGSAAPGTVDDYATIKYNSAGAEQWVSRYNGPGNGSDYALALAVDGAGNVYVTGYSLGTTPGIGYDCGTIKYNSAGDTLWVRSYNGPGNGVDRGYAIAVDGAGNVYVTGYSSASGTSDDYYATIKYNSAGAEQWANIYNGPGNNASDRACAIAVDGVGNVYVTGYSTGSGVGYSYDYATVKYNSAGVEQWVSRYNGTGNVADMATGIAVDGAGNVYVTGNSTGSGTLYDYATIKYNAAGDTLWVRSYDGPGNGSDFAKAIAVDGVGNVYVTGYSPGSGTVDDYATIKYVQAEGIEEHPSLSANRFSLTAEPNPSTKHTTIRYTISISGKVTIKLYNATGRLIETLINEPLNAGTYTLKIENWKLKISKGVYFLKYESDTDKSVLKLIVQ